MIKVDFLLKKNAPVNLKTTSYYVETDNYKIAHEKALIKLTEDLGFLGMHLKLSSKELLKYYERIAMSEVFIIK